VTFQLLLGNVQLVLPVMNRFKTIETCLECSAKKLSNVGEVFYYALKSVLHPTAPLFDPFAQDGQGALKPLAIRALKRIFLMCDADKVQPLLRLPIL
jgi:mitochondrial Rho GTPase 1